MHEVEVKAVLPNPEAFIAKLSEHGCQLGPEITQDDTVFVREVGSLEIFLNNSAFLRLREEKDQTLFTLKYHVDPADNHRSAPIEFELTVSSRDTMEQMLLQMGHQEAVRMKKKRRKGTYKNWEVCVDEVEGLGSFVELEELTDNPENVEQIQHRMKTFLAELGVQAGDQALYRYDILLLQKKYRENEVV